MVNCLRPLALSLAGLVALAGASCADLSALTGGAGDAGAEGSSGADTSSPTPEAAGGDGQVADTAPPGDADGGSDVPSTIGRDATPDILLPDVTPPLDATAVDPRIYCDNGQTESCELPAKCCLVLASVNDFCVSSASDCVSDAAATALMACTGPGNCAYSGTPGDCCALQPGGNLASVECVTAGSCAAPNLVLCTSPGDCPPDRSCTKQTSGNLFGYSVCL